MDAVTAGLDIGTTSTKAVSVDSAGRVVNRVRLPHPLIVEGPDRFEHDARRAWQRGPRRALAALGPDTPRAVGVAAMVPSLAAVDAKGHPLTRGLLYGDARGRSAPPAPAEAEGEAVEDAPGSSGNEVAGFLRWATQAAPDAAGYWPAQAVALRALGGAPSVDLSVAYVASPLFGATGWDPARCRECGARPEQLASVEIPGAAVGRVGGRPDGPLLTAGSVDVWCEQMVAGADSIGDVHVICGTTLIVWAVTPAAGGPEPHPALWCVPHGEADRRLVGGASNAGGLFLDWVRRLVRPAGTAAAGTATGTAAAASAADPAAVPVWVPYLRGERTPYHDPTRRAALHDLDLTHGPAAVMRAGWEASAFVVRHLVDLGAVPAQRIVATGGGTRVAGWMQALADCTGLPVHVAADPEGAARGAAFLARMAAGLETDLRQAAAWARTGSVVEPRPQWAAQADGRYKRFVELSDSMP